MTREPDSTWRRLSRGRYITTLPMSGCLEPARQVTGGAVRGRLGPQKSAQSRIESTLTSDSTATVKHLSLGGHVDSVSNSNRPYI